MSPAQRRYLRFETAIAAVINAVLSAAFVLLAFGGRLVVSPAELVRDAAPQGFFVTLFTILVPGLLTRRRIRAGAVEPLPPRPGRRWPIGVRALVLGIGAALLSVALHALILRWLGGDWTLPALLAAKMAYGAALGAVVARATLPVELAPPRT